MVSLFISPSIGDVEVSFFVSKDNGEFHIGCEGSAKEWVEDLVEVSSKTFCAGDPEISNAEFLNVMCNLSDDQEVEMG